MEQVKVGVVGTGNMGQRHCRIYSNLRGAHLVGVCDAKPELGYKVAKQYNVPFYEQIDDLLQNVDAISLVTPTPFHFELAMSCLAQGVHILIEKPVTETIAQAETLAQAAETSNLVIQVGHIERFNPTYAELKNVLENMTPLVINFRRLSPYQGSNTDVDVVLDLMIHDLDLALNLIGQEPIIVDAYGLTAFNGAIDHVTACPCFKSGPLLTLTASRITEQKIRSVEITTREAYIEGDFLNKSISVHRRTLGEYLNNNSRGVKYRQESVVERIHVPSVEPLFMELQHFIECILEGKSPLVPIEDGLTALRVATRIREAAHEKLIGAPVTVEHLISLDSGKNDNYVNIK